MHMMRVGASWPQWGSWHFSEVVIVVGALGAATLLATWPHLQPRQRLLLSLALVVSEALLASDVQSLSMSNYPCHMVEHIVVILIIAPLVAGALKIRLSRTTATMGFLSFTVLIPLFHLTPLGSAVMNYSEGHDFELVCFLLIGIWFWLPIYGPARTLADQQRIVYCVLALPVIATTGLVLWSATPASLSSVGMNMAGITIADVRDGGVVMMVLGTALMLTHLAALLARSALRQRATREPVGLKYA